MASPRVLIFDIETMANKIYAWGKYEQNAIAYAQHWYMISFAWKWLDEKTVHVKALPDYPLYKKDRQDDSALIRDLWKLFDEADILIGHNIRKFDVKKANARFVKHGLRPPSPSLILDTREIAKKHFRFDSNKLDDLGDYLGVGRKVTHEGFKLWLDCEKGDKGAWAKMKHYNKGDVALNERVYYELRPYSTTHPNIALIKGLKKACPVCGSQNMTQRSDTFTRVTIYKTYQCDDCGAWAKAPEKNDEAQRR